MAEANTQYLDVPIPLGIDTATQAELVQPAKALGIRNCHVGAGALQERRQFTRLTRLCYRDDDDPPTSFHGEVRALLPLGDTLLIATEESRLYAKVDYSSASWIEVERNDAPVSYKRALHCGAVVATGLEPHRYRNPQIAVSGDYACITWWRRQPVAEGEEGSPENVGWAMVYDLARKIIIRIDEIAVNVGIGTSGSVGSNPSLVPIASGGYFYVLWIDTSTNQIKYRALSTTALTPTWSTAGVLQAVTAVGERGVFDAAEIGGVVYVGYNGATLGVLRCTAAAGALTITHSSLHASATALAAISMAVSATRVLIAFANALGETYAWCLNPATLAAVANGAVTIVANAQPSTFRQLSCCIYTITDTTGESEEKATIAWCIADGTERYEFTSFIADVAVEHLTSHTADVFVFVPGVNMCHRPFRQSGLATTANAAPSFLGLRRNQELEDTYYTFIASMAASPVHTETAPTSFVATPVARYSSLTAGYVRGTDVSQAIEEQGVCAVVEHGGRYHWIGVEQVPTYDGDTRDTLHMYSLDFSAARCWGSVTHNGVTLLAGSLPRMISPEVLTYAADARRRGAESIIPMHSPIFTLAGDAGGSLTATATYYYCATFEYTDVHGRVHRGLPSVAQSITLAGANQSVVISLVDQQAPQAGYDYYNVVIWRSVANPPDTNNIAFYRAAQLGVYTSVGLLGDTHDDGASDASIENNEILYTVSGELPNYPPPPSLALCLWKNRIVALDSETGKLWPSKTILEREWPGFHEGLAVGTDVHTSLPVFISEDTDNLIVWWDDAIGVSYGEPGSDTGAIGSLTQPRLLGQRGIGLQYVKSLVRTEIGHMFKSAKGFYLLDPSMGLTYVGHDVEAYNSHVVVGAKVVTTPNGSQEVRFETQGGDDYQDGYVTLVYDLVRQSWHVHTRGRKPLASAVIAGSFYVATQADASAGDSPWDLDGAPDASGVWVEDTSTVLQPLPAADPSGEFQAMLETAWLALAGKIGVSKTRMLWLLGDFFSAVDSSAFPAFARETVISVYRDYVSTVAQTLTMNVANTEPKRTLESHFDRQEVMALRLRIRGFQRLIAMRLEVEAEKGALRRNNQLAG